jgi:alpha-tubulin suppressor-like RCC1 family protein
MRRKNHRLLTFNLFVIILGLTLILNGSVYLAYGESPENDIGTGILSIRNSRPPGRTKLTKEDIKRDRGLGRRAVLMKHSIFLLDRDFIPQIEKDKGHILLQLTRALDAKTKERLKTYGVELLEYIPNNTWKAKIPANSVQQVKALDFVNAMGTIEPVDKFSVHVLEKGFSPYSHNPDGTITIMVSFHRDVSFERAREILSEVSGSTGQEDFISGHRVLLTIPGDKALPLAGYDEVNWIEDRPPPNTLNNVNAAALSHVDDIQTSPYNLNGSGIKIGEWDGGEVQNDHPDLAGRVTIIDTSSVSDHATHVAGTMIGDGSGNSAAKGMAPSATLYSYDFDGDIPAEISSAVSTYEILLTNNSHGYGLGWQYDADYSMWAWYGSQSRFGDYDSNTQVWDQTVIDTGLIIVKSAGNDRNDTGDQAQTGHFHGADRVTEYYDSHDPDCSSTSGYSCMSVRGSAKNIITVGAVDDAGGMTNFSGWGPTDDGRVKPDIVANGWTLTSTFPTGIYNTLSGTSMSTPVVTGTIALIDQHYNDVFGAYAPPQMMKAILIQTATDLEPAGPDYSNGWGLLDGLAAVELIDAGSDHFKTGFITNGVTKEYSLTVPSATSALKFTIAWTDPAGTPGNVKDLVNDIDIELVDPSGGVHYPWKLNKDAPSVGATKEVNEVDNVEQVVVDGQGAYLEEGDWTLRIIGNSIQNSQSFALVGNLPLSLGGLQSNIALDKPVTVSVNGNDYYECAGMSPSDITDGDLSYTLVHLCLEDGVVGYRNEDSNELMEVTVTIDLQGTYDIYRIRYNMGNVLRANTWNADLMTTPFGTTATNPGTYTYGGAWTEQTGNATLSTVAITFQKTRTSWETDWLFIGEIEVYGSESEPQPPPTSGVAAIAVGYVHTVALKSDGTVWAWGAGGDGQLGDSTMNDSHVPVQVSGLSGVVAIAAGWSHSVALKSDGTVWAWGNNEYGQLGDGTTTRRLTPVQVSGLNDVVAIAAGGEHHTVALKSDGTVWAWGDNWHGQVGDGTYNNHRSTPVQVSGLSDVVAIATGGRHTIALKSDGTIWAWGDNYYGQLGDGTYNNDRYTPVQVSGLSGVIAIDGGGLHTVALKSDGTVWAWGNNWYGQLGDGSTTDKHTPIQVSGLSGAVAIAAGAAHTVAVKSDGTVWAWGSNDQGQLGDGTTTERHTPVQVSGLGGVAAVSAGDAYHTVAVKSDGTVWVWGWNYYGQLGDGTATDRYTPVEVFLSWVVHDFNGDGHADILGVNSAGKIWWYDISGDTWHNVAGSLEDMEVGDFNGDGNDDLMGLNASGQIWWYDVDGVAWNNIPGSLASLGAGDFNGDGNDDIAGLNASGQIWWYDVYGAAWHNIPGSLAFLETGNFNGDGNDDLAGLNASGQIWWYDVDGVAWHNIPGSLASFKAGDLNGDGNDDIAGLNASGKIWWYDVAGVAWHNIPGSLASFEVGDFNGDGQDDLAGLNASGQIWWYDVNGASWYNIPGTLVEIMISDYDGDGYDDIAGLNASGQIWYTTDLNNWQNIPGNLVGLY